MASSSSTSWIPPKGKHSVNIGSSLGRAIRNRKNKGSPAATTKKSNLPERDFYSFKFNFKASSIDAAKPATIKKGADLSQVTAEYPSTQTGEIHIFTGQEQPTKEVECVLIFDEETGVFTLEKIDSSVQFKFDRKQALSHEASPAPTPSSSKGKAKQEDYDTDHGKGKYIDDGEIDGFDEILPDHLLRREEEEEEGEEPEIPLTQIVASKPKPARPPPPSAPKNSQPSTSRPVKPVPKLRAEAKAPAVAPTPPVKMKPPPPSAQLPPKPSPSIISSTSSASAPKQKPTPPAAPAATTTTTVSKAPKRKAVPVPAPMPTPSSVPKAAKAAAPSTTVEIIDIPKAPPVKRARPSIPAKQSPPPPPPEPVVLSLPGASTGVSLPTAPISSKPKPPTSRAVPQSQPSAPSPPPLQEDSDDEEDYWEPVSTLDQPVATEASKDVDFLELALEEEDDQQDNGELFGDEFIEVNGTDGGDMEVEEGEEINEDVFAAELDAEMQDQEDDDFSEGAFSPAPEADLNKIPISLNRLAAGANGGHLSTDDEYSSSDDSDDD